MSIFKKKKKRSGVAKADVENNNRESEKVKMSEQVSKQEIVPNDTTGDELTDVKEDQSVETDTPGVNPAFHTEETASENENAAWNDDNQSVEDADGTNVDKREPEGLVREKSILQAVVKKIKKLKAKEFLKEQEKENEESSDDAPPPTVPRKDADCWGSTKEGVGETKDRRFQNMQSDNERDSTEEKEDKKQKQASKEQKKKQRKKRKKNKRDTKDETDKDENEEGVRTDVKEAKKKKQALIKKLFKMPKNPRKKNKNTGAEEETCGPDENEETTDCDLKADSSNDRKKKNHKLGSEDYDENKPDNTSDAESEEEENAQEEEEEEDTFNYDDPFHPDNIRVGRELCPVLVRNRGLGSRFPLDIERYI